MSQADFNPAEGGRAVFVRKQTANIYTMMLILAFLAISIGVLFLFLEMKAYDGLTTQVSSDAKVPPPQVFTTPDAATPDAAEPDATPAENTAPLQNTTPENTPPANTPTPEGASLVRPQFILG
jgi:hypothetical protein